MDEGKNNSFQSMKEKVRNSQLLQNQIMQSWEGLDT